MNDHEWQEVIGTIGIFVLLTAVVVTIIWQGAISWRAKAQLARESEYKQLAEAAVAGQQNIERKLAEIGGQVSELQGRTDSIERVLKDVE
ncbi:MULTISPECIES: hypothetical protein [unclassified Streptomyces]|uniref:hypothetical protein n=1 Tax=unclassified Streptomyces TaxID=2593676 RepID=UPI0036A3E89E